MIDCPCRGRCSSSTQDKLAKMPADMGACRNTHLIRRRPVQMPILMSGTRAKTARSGSRGRARRGLVIIWGSGPPSSPSSSPRSRRARPRPVHRRRNGDARVRVPDRAIIGGARPCVCATPCSRTGRTSSAWLMRIAGGDHVDQTACSTSWPAGSGVQALSGRSSRLVRRARFSNRSSSTSSSLRRGSQPRCRLGRCSPRRCTRSPIAATSCCSCRVWGEAAARREASARHGRAMYFLVHRRAAAVHRRRVLDLRGRAC